MSDINIQNIVVSCDLFAENLSIDKIVKEIKDVQYDPSRFPGACVRLKEPKVSILVFSSGRVVISGIKSEDMIMKSINVFKNMLKGLGVTFSKKPSWKIQNMVASGNVGFPLDLNKIIYRMENTEYNPEQFPGLVYKPTGTRLSFLLFNSGRIVCTGGKSREEISSAVDSLIKRLKEL